MRKPSDKNFFINEFHVIFVENFLGKKPPKIEVNQQYLSI